MSPIMNIVFSTYVSNARVGIAEYDHGRAVVIVDEGPK